MTKLGTTLEPKHKRVCKNCLLPFLGKTVSTMYCAKTCKRKYQHKTKYILKGRRKYKTEEERKLARKKSNAPNEKFFNKVKEFLLRNETEITDIVGFSKGDLTLKINKNNQNIIHLFSPFS